MSTLGRPTAYKPEYCELTHSYCLLGATAEELAEFFDVTRGTINNWIATIPEFATKRGLASPDDGDALALTFAYPVAKRDGAEERRFEEGLARLKRWVR
jgi:hypothetical protein